MAYIRVCDYPFGSMHAYSKRFLQVLLMGIRMATYMVDARLPEIKFVTGEGSKNFEILLVNPNLPRSSIRWVSSTIFKFPKC